jgi:hypothetical protein
VERGHFWALPVSALRPQRVRPGEPGLLLRVRPVRSDSPMHRVLPMPKSYASYATGAPAAKTRRSSRTMHSGAMPAMPAAVPSRLVRTRSTKPSTTALSTASGTSVGTDSGQDSPSQPEADQICQWPVTGLSHRLQLEIRGLSNLKLKFKFGEAVLTMELLQ